MSAIGTKQTSRHVRSNVANGVKADIIGSLRAFPLLNPQRTFSREPNVMCLAWLVASAS